MLNNKILNFCFFLYYSKNSVYLGRREHNQKKSGFFSMSYKGFLRIATLSST